MLESPKNYLRYLVGFRDQFGVFKANMGCLFDILRSVLALVLGVVVFFGFLSLLLLNNVSDKMLSADFYIDTLDAEDTYERVYTDVLLDDELRGTTQDLLGDVEVTQEDIVDLLREVMPPEYLRSQVEGSIQRTVDYFNEERDTLELYVELGPPLDNIKPALLGYIDERIGRLPLEKPVISRCDVEIIQDVATRYKAIFRELGDGKVPASIPSFEEIDDRCRGPIFDLTFDLLTSESSLDPRTRASLQEVRSELRLAFVDGDTTGVWKIAAPAVAGPVMYGRINAS